MSEKHVVLGKISGLFGVRGWLKIHSHSRPIDNLINYQRWFLDHPVEGCHYSWRPFRVVDAKPHGKTLIAQLAGPDGRVIGDRDEAAALLQADIAVARADMPQLAAGEYYWRDLVGLEVINREAETLGRVTAMMETGANDVLVVKGDAERLIPFVTGFTVDKIDLEAGVITVDWGLDF